MNYEYYKVFYLVATQKNFTRAAEMLYSSQPAISRTISNMESELNCKLFIRSKSGVRLTKEGQELFDRVGESCDKLLRADQDFMKFVSLSATTVYVGATVTALYCFLFDFLENYRKKRPNVHFKIHTGSSGKLIADLKSGRLDVVFNTTPFMNAENLSVVNVKEFEDVLVAGGAYKGLIGQPIEAADLKKYPTILLSKGMSFRTHIDNFFATKGESASPETEADSSSLIVPLVEKNWGLAFVPEKMAEEYLESGKIIKLDFKETLPKRSVCMVTDKTKKFSAPVREMVRMIKERGE